MHALNLANSCLHASRVMSVYVVTMHLPYADASAAQVTVECIANLRRGEDVERLALLMRLTTSSGHGVSKLKVLFSCGGVVYI